MLPSPGSLTHALAETLDSGRRRLGQLAIHAEGDPTTPAEQAERFWLCHVDDLPHLLEQPEQLETHQGAQAALEIARLDDQGEYRPLLTAPSLRHGWKLELDKLQELVLALNFFYPAALGTWLAAQKDQLPIEMLRDKLGRQTGMYASTTFVTAEGVAELVTEQCGSKCLKNVLWDIGSEEPNQVRTSIAEAEAQAAGKEMPLYCFEACNLLVAATRRVSQREYKAKLAAEAAAKENSEA